MESANTLLLASMKTLRRYAMTLARSSDGADELVQATCLRTLEKFHLFDSRTPNSSSDFVRWSTVIMRNIFIEGMRKTAKRGTSPLDDIPIYDMPLSATGDLRSCDAVLDMRRAVLSLTANQRRAAILSAIGMQVDEISKLDGVMAGTVKSRVSRIRAQLKAKVDS